MKNGDPHEFVDHLYSGQDTVFVFHGVKYWFQGYTVKETGTDHMEIFQYQPPPNPTEDYYIWTYDADLYLSTKIGHMILNNRHEIE